MELKSLNGNSRIYPIDIPELAEKVTVMVKPPLMAFTVAVTVSDEVHRGKLLRAEDTSDGVDDPLKRSVKERDITSSE